MSVRFKMEWYKFIIFGRVQGVFYRKFVSQAMMKKQYKGYMQNLSDGTVEVVAEVFDDDFDTFTKILNEGSPLSSVEDVKYEIFNEAEFRTDGFEIRYWFVLRQAQEPPVRQAQEPVAELVEAMDIW